MSTPEVALLSDEPVASFTDYLAQGGGRGLERALTMTPEDVANEVLASGVRGRGGAGFPTGRKWLSVRENLPDANIYLVCNGAEGEPGTFKDRTLIAYNPYRLVEGVLVALHAVEAQHAYIATKMKFTHERARLADAIDSAIEAGWKGADRLEVFAGPDEYLYGEESAMLEAIEGRLPMPRILPPYMFGLFASTSAPNPTVVNNVETLSHVANIMAHGPDWFRTVGTQEAPGTMLFTVIGDCDSPGVYELPLGTSLRELLVDIAGAHDIKAIYSGTSNPVILPHLLDLPLDFDSFREAEVGMGSGGFMVYDHTRDIVQITAVLSRFLAVESCGQCNACKLGNHEIWKRLAALVEGRGTATDIEEIRKRCITVTDANRCYLPVGTSMTVASTLEAFSDEFTAHIGVASDPAIAVGFPKINNIDHDTGEVTLDPNYFRKRTDWSYAPTT